MAVFRVNLYNTFENALKRRAFSAPSKTNREYNDFSDLSHWSELEKIKKGNLLLLCRGIYQIWSIAFATDDCRITNVDAFREEMRYERNGFRYVNFKVYKELVQPIDGKIYFDKLFEKENPFIEPHLCMQLNPITNRLGTFNKAINHLLEIVQQ
ncbi:MAG: hypothetical protein L6Q54_01205 [Leptospiraceae bacterium]|nr:hypothetical protein [Leptospiraceae bacterium]MCK6379857.1 hypothetical protein [Leptospiraceae bacterium]